jgi:glycosyltransferase involved in cell wall biosynthesis
MRNVIIVCDGAGPTGGTERVAITSALGLQQRGFNVAYFAGEPISTPELDGINCVSLNLADAYNSSKAEVLKRFVWNSDAATAFGKLLTQYSPMDTVIHVHAFRRILSGAVIKEAKRQGFKLVFTLHDFGLVCPNTTLYIAPKNEICHIQPLSLACKTCQCTHKGWPMKIMQTARGSKIAREKIAQDFDHLIYVSEFSRKIIEPHLPKSTPSTTIYNPVSSEQQPIATQRGDTFTYVGRLSQEKGVVGFARAARIADVKCQFIGDGPEREAILAANPTAILTGWLAHSEVQTRIGQSRAVVMPSLWYETAGLAVIEAVAQGIPAIVAKNCASTEYVEHGKTGVHYQGEKELATILTAMTQEHATELGEAAYDHYWQAPLTTKKHLDQLIQVYQSLV